jgi:hypothetical protein
VLVLGLPVGKTLPGVAWTAVAVLVEFLLGIRQNVPPDYARAPGWGHVEVRKGVDFQYTNPLVNGCAGATNANPRLATDGSCKAVYLNITVRTKWRSELNGSLATPNTLSNDAKGAIAAYKDTAESTVGVLASRAVVVAGSDTSTGNCDNPASPGVCMSTWWTGPFVHDVPSVVTRSIYDEPPSYLYPPPDSVSLDDDLGVNWTLAGLFIALGVLLVGGVALGFLCMRRRQAASADAKVAGVDADLAGALNGSLRYTQVYRGASGHKAAGTEVGLGVDYGYLKSRQDEADRTMSLRFDLGDVLTRYE